MLTCESSRSSSTGVERVVTSEDSHSSLGAGSLGAVTVGTWGQCCSRQGPAARSPDRADTTSQQQEGGSQLASSYLLGVLVPHHEAEVLLTGMVRPTVSSS